MVTNKEVSDLYTSNCTKSSLELFVIYTSKFPELATISNHQFLSLKIKKVRDRIKLLNRNKDGLESYLQRPFLSLTTAGQSSTDSIGPAGDNQSATSDRLSSQFEQMKLVNKNLKRKVVSLESACDKLNDAQIKYEASLDELGRLNISLDSVIKDFSTQDKHMQSQLDEIETQYEEKCNDLDSKLFQIRSLKKKVSESKYENKLLNKKIARRESVYSGLDVLRSDRNKLSRELEDACNLVTNLEAQLMEKNELIDNVDVKNKSLTRSISYYRKKASDKIVEIDNEHQYQNTLLECKIKSLEKDNYELQQLVELLDDPVIMTFENGRYTDEIRQVVMNLLAMNVSITKISGVISVVLSKLANKKVKLPSDSSKSRFVAEANCLAKMQLLESMKTDPESFKGVCLHTDGTSKFHKKYENYQITLLDGTKMSLGLHEVAYADTDHLMESFKDLINELNHLTLADQSDASELRVAEIVASIKNTVTDQGSVNPCFNKKLHVFREELLPLVIENWDSINSSNKSHIAGMGNFFCKMHLLVNFATEADKTLALFENVATDENTVKSTSVIQTNESGPARLVRTAVKALHHRGSEEAGVASDFTAYLQSLNNKSKLISYRGNRFNVLFYDAAAVFYHRNHIVDFLESLCQSNRLLQAVLDDITNKVNIAGIRALGIIDKIITGPYWRMLSKTESDGILGANTYLRQMQCKLEQWSVDASSLLLGDLLFLNDNELAVHKDDAYDSLFSATDDSELDCLTQQALELLCRAMLILLERQAVDQLPGGKYWEPSSYIKNSTKSVPTTNVVSERDFAILDMLVRTKPSGTVLLYETLTLWMNNKTLKWLDGKSNKERVKLMDIARKNGPLARKMFKERQLKISKQKIERLFEKQKKREEMELKSQNKTADLTNKISCAGGVWLTIDDVESRISNLSSESSEREAIINQLNFRRHIMKCKGDKNLFFQSQTVGGERIIFSNEQLICNLKEVITLNPHVSDDITTASSSSTVKVRAESERQVMFDEQKSILFKKLQAARDKRIIDAQIDSLPLYLENPNVLVGKFIKHRCKDESGQETSWYDGEVVKIVKLGKDTLRTEYDVKYKDDEDIWHFPLLMDLKHGDLIIN